MWKSEENMFIDRNVMKKLKAYNDLYMYNLISLYKKSALIIISCVDLSELENTQTIKINQV